MKRELTILSRRYASALGKYLKQGRRVIIGGSGLVTHGASILSMNVKGR